MGLELLQIWQTRFEEEHTMQTCNDVYPVVFQLSRGRESQNGKSRLMHLDGLLSVWEDILKPKLIGLEL
jgi:hypothetical protein